MKPYRCPECEKSYITTGDFSSCPNGHGRLRPKSEGVTPSEADQYAKRESTVAALAAMPIAVGVPKDIFHFSVYTISGLPGLYFYSVEKTDLRAKLSNSSKYFQRASEIEQTLVTLGWKLEQAER